jgi:hypothetical protein
METWYDMSSVLSLSAVEGVDIRLEACVRSDNLITSWMLR